MSKKQSTENVQTWSSHQFDEWDQAIVTAEEEIHRAERRIAELRVSILSFRRLKKNGMPFPSGPRDGSTLD
jgi:hypothetical protein